MPDLPLLLHVGYHKTATTWMQKRLFQPRNGFRQLANHREVFAHIVKPHGLFFEAEPMRKLIAARRADLALGEVPVISSEILSGHPFLAGRESDIYAARLAEIAPDARILISIRAQHRILPSVYTQYLLRGGTLPYDRFFDGTDEPGYFGFAPEHFEYDRLVRLYQDLFGADRVYLMTQESLKTDMEAAAAALARFAQADGFTGLSQADRQVYAPGYPEHALPVLRRLNHVQSSTLNPWPILRLGRTPVGLYKSAGWILRRPPVSTLFGHRKPVSDHVAERFRGHYAASNARLAAIMAHPVDLSDYEGAAQPVATPAARAS